jgi:hypothetical protein
LILNAFDDDATPYLVWMPAHKKDEEAGTITIGNGEPLSLKHIRGNRAVDTQAKMAVTEHRSDARTVQEWNQVHESIRQRARWIARATVLANSLPDAPYRDTEASRATADRIKRQRSGGRGPAASLEKLVKRQWIRRTPELGGHSPQQTRDQRSSAKTGARSGWTCKICKRQSANYRKFASQRCEGSAATRWATKAVQLADMGATVGRGHVRVLSGETLWCLTCGAFADTKAMQLTGTCKGAPTVRGQGHYGGMWGQRLKLLKGIHPRHGTCLPPPIYEDGTCVHSGVYLNLPSVRNTARTDGTEARHLAVQGSSVGSVCTMLQIRDGRSAFAKMRERVCEKERLAKLKLANECGHSGWWGTGLRRRRTGKQSASANGHAGELGADHSF